MRDWNNFMAGMMAALFVCDKLAITLIVFFLVAIVNLIALRLWPPHTEGGE